MLLRNDMKLGNSTVFLVTILLLSIPNIDVKAGSSQSYNLTSTLPDGSLINGTLVANGSTQISPLNVTWSIFSLASFEGTQFQILRNGTFFTTVTPISENLWVWTLSVDVSDLQCTCALTIIQGDVRLERIIFIGTGPHKPVMIPEHDSVLTVDEPIKIKTKGYVAVSDLNQSSLLVSTCYAPNGACERPWNFPQLNVSWNGNLGEIEFDPSRDLGMQYDGRYLLNYQLRDAMLHVSENVTIQIVVDNTNPEAIFTFSTSYNINDLHKYGALVEGREILLDGSGSNDGVWGSKLQAIWYIESPDGRISILYDNQTISDESLSTTQGLHPMVRSLTPYKSGVYTITLQVIDQVGRSNQSVNELYIWNMRPIVAMAFDGGRFTEDSPSGYVEIHEGDDVEFSFVSFEERNFMFGNESEETSWYLNGELIGTSDSCDSICNFDVSDLKPGEYELRVVVMDEDGANDSISQYFEIIENQEEFREKTGMLSLGIGLLVVISLIFYVVGFKSKKKFSGVPKWELKSDDNSESSKSSLEEMWEQK